MLHPNEGTLSVATDVGCVEAQTLGDAIDAYRSLCMCEDFSGPASVRASDGAPVADIRTEGDALIVTIYRPLTP